MANFFGYTKYTDLKGEVVWGSFTREDMTLKQAIDSITLTHNQFTWVDHISDGYVIHRCQLFSEDGELLFEVTFHPVQDAEQV